MEEQRTILVTVGTTKFDKLINIVDSPNFVSCILELGYNNLIIQYGSGSPPTNITSSLSRSETSLTNDYSETSTKQEKRPSKHFLPKDEDRDRAYSPSPRVKFSAQKLPSFNCNAYDFKPSLQPDLLSSSLVISHAGAGSILETLRLKPLKPLIVVINDCLMHNHQEELAEEMAKKKYLFYTTPEKLIQTLREVNFEHLVPFQSDKTNTFAKLLDQHMGFS